MVIGVTGPADRLLAAGLEDLDPLLARLRGHVLIVGGLMARVWLNLRPVEEIPPRATADVDLGIDRQGLRLTSASELVKPMLEDLDYRPVAGDDGFRFRKTFAAGEALLVDLFIPKGQSRAEPPLLEKNVETLAAPGLVYAVARGPYFVEVEFVDADRHTVVELPLPTLDAAFVLKAALAASGVRVRRDRRQRDRVDSVMLAAACLQDPTAVAALRDADNKEAAVALRWLRDELDHAEAVVPRTVGEYLETEFEVAGGADWAVQVATQFHEALTS